MKENCDSSPASPPSKRVPVKLIAKVCGVKDVATARELAALEELSVLGVVFEKKSVRYVEDLSVVTAIRQVAEENGKEVWGIFTGQSAKDIAEVVRVTGIHGIQLHSAVCAESVRELDKKLTEEGATKPQRLTRGWGQPCSDIQQARRIWVRKVAASEGNKITGTEPSDFQNTVDFILVDAAIAGSGKVFDWEEAAAAFERDHSAALGVQMPKEKDREAAALLSRVLIAGGLEPANIEAAMSAFPRVGGFDVSSGVEDPRGSGKKSLELAAAFCKSVDGGMTGRPSSAEVETECH